MDSQLIDTLRQTIKVAAPSTAAANAYGERAYGSVSSVSARVIGKQVMIRNAEGQEIMSSKQIIVNTTAITIQHKIWLPGESTSSLPHYPAAIGIRVDENGNTDHVKLWLALQYTG